MTSANVITCTGAGSDTWAYRIKHPLERDHRTKAVVLGPCQAPPPDLKPGAVIITHDNDGRGGGQPPRWATARLQQLHSRQSA